jgi:predicted kinase
MEPTFKRISDIQLTLEYVSNPALPFILLNVGVSGSGKSTFSCELVKNDRKFVRVSRDDIRAMLFGFTDEDHKEYYTRKDLFKYEEVVTQVQDNAIRAALNKGKSVVMDSTNLKMSYINYFKNFGYPIELAIHDLPLEECIERDSKRSRTVGREVIERQYRDFTNLKKLLEV